MAQYTPKSKVKILYTSGKEFVELSTNIPYQGKYLEYSNGKFFSGNNSQNPGGEIIRKKQTIPNFRPSVNNYQYKNLQKEIHTNLTKKKPIPVTKNKPTSKDYERGYFTRYFCKRVNDEFNYFEISEETYKLIISSDPQYDFNLYQTGNIKWTLLGTPNKSLRETNFNIITLKLTQYPFLNIFFENLNEYEPTHTNNRGVLYYDSGKPYEGYYHIHPTKGFMEGAAHTDKFHRILQASPPKSPNTISTRDRGRILNQGRISNQGESSISSGGGGY
jgi:hypothetical protein